VGNVFLLPTTFLMRKVGNQRTLPTLHDFDGKNVLRMRYELTKRLMLETETGTESGGDLRYTLER
jgi:hypothetical protein